MIGSSVCLSRRRPQHRVLSSEHLDSPAEKRLRGSHFEKEFVTQSFGREHPSNCHVIASLRLQRSRVMCRKFIPHSRLHFCCTWARVQKGSIDQFCARRRIANCPNRRIVERLQTIRSAPETCFFSRAEEFTDARPTKSLNVWV
jgi:hypothetical protein